MRQLHEQLISTEDSDELLAVLLQYQAWLNTLEAGQQFELRELSSSERVRHIRRMIQREHGDPDLMLSNEELHELAVSIGPLLDSQRERVLSQLSPREKERVKRKSGLDKLTYLTLISRGEFVRSMDRLLPAIAAALPPEKRRRFQQLPLPAKLSQLAVWRKQAWSQFGDHEARNGPKRGQRDVSEQELERFFDESVDAVTKERLLAMPRDQMQRQLRLGGPPHREDRPPDGPPPEFRRGDRRPPNAGPPRRIREDLRQPGVRPPREQRRPEEKRD